MSSDEMTPHDAAIELSDEDLDDVTGGLKLQFTLARTQSSKIAFAQGPSGSGCGAPQSAFQAETFAAELVQLQISDATADDIKALSGLFGGAALEGSD